MQDPIADFLHWYRARPIITKMFLTCSFLIATALSAKLLAVSQIYYDLESSLTYLQLWRPLTSLLFLGNLSFSFVIKAYLMYLALYYSEKQIFERERIADFWVLLIYVFSCMVLFASIVDIYFIADGFALALIYVWSQVKPFSKVNLVFGITMTSTYFPWVFFGFSVLFGESFFKLIAGLPIGWCYLYIKGAILNKYNIDLLKTPSLLQRWAKIYLEKVDARQRNQSSIEQQQNFD